METMYPEFDSATFAQWVDGSAQALPARFCGVTQDSRDMTPGCLYVAIRGTRFDGHDFVRQALQAEAAAAMVADDWDAPAAADTWPLLRVRDTRHALADAACAWRRTQQALVVGITGSSGKTTTKEMTAAFLATSGRVCATQGNRNNDLGLPLSLLTMMPDATYGVFEMGSSHPGEIAALTDVLRPQAAVITSIGSAHIEHFGSLEAIIQEKGAVLRALPSNGFTVLCHEVVGFDQLCSFSSAPVVTTSMVCDEADYYGELLDAVKGTLRVTERANNIQTVLESGLPGMHNASNLLLAFTTARQAGVAALDASRALQKLSLPGMRWEVVMHAGVQFVNDAYNANPQSMMAALKTFMLLPCSGRRYAVLGDMLELGLHTERLHREVGRCVAEIMPECLLAIGKDATRFLADEAIRAGFDQTRVACAADAKAAAATLKKSLRPGDAVLLKASRGMRLEQILENV